MPTLRIHSGNIYIDGVFISNAANLAIVRPEYTLPEETTTTYDGSNRIINDSGNQYVIAGSWDLGDLLLIDGDNIVQDIEDHYSPPLPTAEEAYNAKVVEIVAKANTIMSTGPLAKYPAAEQMTWSQQEAEAIAWNADNNASTPMIDSIVTASAGALLKSSVVAKILLNAPVMRSLSASVVSQRSIHTAAVNAIKADVVAGNEPVTTLINHPIAYTMPGYSLTDK